jgi:hypothetical protein
VEKKLAISSTGRSEESERERERGGERESGKQEREVIETKKKLKERDEMRVTNSIKKQHLSYLSRHQRSLPALQRLVHPEKLL